MGETGIEQHALSGGGFTRIHVRDDTDITVALNWRLPGHNFTVGLEVRVFKNDCFQHESSGNTSP
jgi:hypothetical protein